VRSVAVALRMLERRTQRIGQLELERLELMAELHRAGVSSRRIAAAVGVSHVTAQARLRSGGAGLLDE
jgi:IS30 family transposase